MKNLKRKDVLIFLHRLLLHRERNAYKVDFFLNVIFPFIHISTFSPLWRNQKRGTHDSSSIFLSLPVPPPLSSHTLPFRFRFLSPRAPAPADRGVPGVRRGAAVRRVARGGGGEQPRRVGDNSRGMRGVREGLYERERLRA